MPSVFIALLEALLEFEGDYVLVELSVLFQFFLVNHCCIFLVNVFLIFPVEQTGSRDFAAVSFGLVPH